MVKNKKIPFGIVQGRLSKPPNNELQWFPQDYWESEFFLAKALGFRFIELIAERTHNPDNPIWSDTGIKKIKDLCEKNDLMLYAICNDYIIDNDILGPKHEEVYKQMLHFADKAGLLGMKTIVLPLFEESELNQKNVKDFLPILIEYANYTKKLNLKISLETILNGEQLIDVIDSMKCENVNCVFDTGNRVAHGHDILSDIRLLGERIGHVHLKDKNQKDENVLLGNGLVNFYEVMRALKEIQYDAFYTFETNRGSNPINTAVFNQAFCQYCYQEA